MDSLTLKVRNFAQISEVSVTFGDLTVLVGPQATGKSLLLQLLKFGLDRTVIARRLAREGFARPESAHDLPATFLGEGYENCFGAQTEIQLGQTNLLRTGGRTSGREPRVFFVPAQRVVSFFNGWPRPFSDYGAGDPFVVREFSQQLFDFFGRGLGKDGAPIFPNADRLKAPIRKSIENSIFHGGKLQLRRDGPRKQLTINYDYSSRTESRSTVRKPNRKDVSLPFLEWSAGQREFTPLLLGLYQLLPGGRLARHPGYQWAVIEEPEMGLHPMAINSVMLLVFELIHRGYRVALSTHAPYVLDLVWAVTELQKSSSNRREQLLMQAVGATHPALKPIASTLLSSSIRVYALGHDANNGHICRDISTLDPSSTDEIVAGWGGITSLSRNVSTAVARSAISWKRKGIPTTRPKVLRD